MRTVRFELQLTALVILLPICHLSYSQSRGLGAITENDLRYHLEFLGTREFRGRETPSHELEIATLYIGNWARFNGLKTILKDGSFYQSVPLTVTSVFQPETRIKVSGRNRETINYFGKSFGGNFTENGSYSGNVIFAGLGISDPEKGWDDLKDLDLTGKIVLLLDERRPDDKYLSGASLPARLNERISVIRSRGASAVLSVVNSERERRMNTGSTFYDYLPTGRLGILYDSQRTSFPYSSETVKSPAGRPALPFTQAEINHALAAEILGIPTDEIDELFNLIKQGKQVPSKELKDVRVQLDVNIDTYESSSRNVIAMVEGSDPVLKNEYIVICGHHDARGIDDGEIIPGADDNATAAVALMEIAGALKVQRPKRTVILCWFTGEEQGMNGSQYFINNCPVPVEKISACLNMDMLGRNSRDSLYLVGSDLLSSGLDASINNSNKKAGINFGFNYTYSSVAHPQRVYFRSDHYPFVRFGIPSVWFFSGFTHDYHTPRDITELIDYAKFCKITKLVYQTAYDIGNMKDLLKLDVNPAVTSRGSHNLTEKSLFQPAGK